MADEPKLSAAQRSKIRRLSAPVEMTVDEEGGELNIVPFLDMVVNILMFVLATVAVTFTATIESNPPNAGGGAKIRPRENASLSLSLIITNDGVSLKGAGGNVAPGCEGLGPGITFPSKGKSPEGDPLFDSEAITTCAQKLKDQSPEFKEETQIRITASNNISYKKIIECADAVRRSKDGDPLFPDILFAVPR